MKINKRSNKKKYAVITATVLLFFVVAVLAFINKDQVMSFFGINQETINGLENNVTIDHNPPTQEQIDAGQIQKETSNEPSNNDLGISITYIDTSADTVIINSVINGAVTSSGVCSIELSSGEKSVDKEVATYALPSSSTCMGFTINKNELHTGTWQIKLSVTVNSQTSTVYDEFILE